MIPQREDQGEIGYVYEFVVFYPNTPIDQRSKCPIIGTVLITPCKIVAGPPHFQQTVPS